MSFLPLSGKLAQIRVGTWVFYGKMWSFEPSTVPIDVTTYEDGSARWIGSVLDGEGEISDSEYNGASGGSIFSNPPNMLPGSQIAMTLYVAGVGGTGWVFTAALITNTPMSASVRGTVKIPSIKFKGNGTYGSSTVGWTYPTQ